ncbi:cytochrome P450 family protein [Allosalinactinospora lopnorensis]|uniref:cytochrome P450 family protein n=1 Tax=Allosalinactinospora lopnorensis TaxID=1352348 RepID=UPI000623BC8A|nr:cytochrome P450 [Allosalinactinospora lopnorensis]
MSTSATTGTARTDPAVNLTDPDFLADPYTAVAALREQGPAVRAAFLDGSQLWMFIGDEEVRSLLSDPRFVVDPASVPGGRGQDKRLELMRQLGISEDLTTYLTEGVLDHDAPDHTRLRKLVSRAFTVRRVSELRPRVEQITDDLLDALPGHAEDGVVDLLEHFGYPLPITVICELVGVPEEDRPLWRKWGHTLVTMGSERMNDALREMVDHIRAMIEQRRSEPSDDLLGALIRVREENGDRLTETELITMVFTLIMAGHETTAHLICNGTVALLTHPEQLDLVRRDPERLPAAVHELQRWCHPVLMTRLRYTAEDVELGGVRLKVGEPVQALLLGANRDPRKYTDPDRFDITRRPSGRGEEHVGFGHGPHYCLGAALARQEAEVAFGKLFSAYPELEPAVAEAELEWMPRPAMRRLVRLPVRL